MENTQKAIKKGVAPDYRLMSVTGEDDAKEYTKVGSVWSHTDKKGKPYQVIIMNEACTFAKDEKLLLFRNEPKQ